MKKWWLAQFNDNWADEMNISGFELFNNKDKEEYIKAFSSHKDSITYCIGTNEEIEYKDGKDILSNITWVSIDAETYLTLSELFFGSFGFFPDLDLIDYEGDEE